MKIAFLSMPFSGGAAKAAERVMHAVQKYHGHDCSFFSLSPGPNEGHDTLSLTNDQIFYTRLLFRYWESLTTSETRWASRSELFSDSTSIPLANFAIPKTLQEADVLHLHWVAGILLTPFLAELVAGKKVIWTLHDFNAFTGGCHYHHNCTKFMAHCELCPMLKNPSEDDLSASSFRLKQQFYNVFHPIVVSPSHWLADMARQSALLGKERIETIPNCIDTSVFRPIDKAAQRDRMGLSPNSCVLLIGAESLDNPRKNAGIFFEALFILYKHDPSLPIEIITYGNGNIPELPYPVYPQGFVENEQDMAALYSAADIYVHTAFLDNLPNTLCEAQCCGLPAIAFDIGGCPEIIKPEVTGFLVGECTAEALAEKLLLILKQPEQLIAMGKAAREMALICYDEKKIASAYCDLYEQAKPMREIPSDHKIHALLNGSAINSLTTLLKYSCQEFNLVNLRTDGQLQDISRQIQVLGNDFYNFREKIKNPVHTLIGRILARFRSE